MQQSGRDNGNATAAWAIAFALAVAAFLVGLVLSWWLVAIGGGIALLIGAAWTMEYIRSKHPDLLEETEEAAAQAPAAPAQAAGGPVITRSRFLEAGTLGLGAVMGGAITVPAVGFMVAPAFEKQRHGDANVGPISNFKQDEFYVTTFLLEKAKGDVSRRTAYVRYNGELNGQPSFSIISSRCAHLGCPVQPSGPTDDETKKEFETSNGPVSLTVTHPAGFSCPCHGGSYDIEGNRTAGPPTRALDRYDYSIVDGNLYIGGMYSVGTVKGTGKDAKIRKFELQAPGQHADDWEWFLYPGQPPH